MGQAIAPHPVGQQQSADLRQIPQSRGDERKKEATVAVQHTEAPGTHDEHAGHREQNPDQVRRDLRDLRAGADQQGLSDPWREEHTQRAQQSGGGQDESEDGGRQAFPLGRLGAAGLERLRVHGDERGRQRALSQQIADDVRDLDGGVVGVGQESRAEEGRYRHITPETGQATQEDPGANGRGAARSRRTHRSAGRPWPAESVWDVSSSVTRFEAGPVVAVGALDQVSNEIGFLAQALQALAQILHLGLQLLHASTHLRRAVLLLSSSDAIGERLAHCGVQNDGQDRYHEDQPDYDGPVQSIHPR